MNEKEYLSDRIEDQIDWYDKKSQGAQRWFKFLRLLEIMAAIAIPLIAGFGEEPFPTKFAVGMLGGLIAFISAVLSLCQFQEKWTEYRTTSESLKHEKFLYLTKADPYQNDAPFQLFAKRVESLISKENSRWSEYTKSGVKSSKQGNGEG